MVYAPEEYPPGARVPFQDATDDDWKPMFNQSCTFTPQTFLGKMMTIIKNPNLNTSWLFRADIQYDDSVQVQIGNVSDDVMPRVREIVDIHRQRILVRTLVPRNPNRDAPLNQTCTIHQAEDDDGSVRTLIIYIPHVHGVADMPFYHPKVRGVAQLHTWDSLSEAGSISVHFLPFPGDSLQDKKTRRTAYHLLELIYRHGQAADYVKQVHHDLIIPQNRSQDRYTLLKTKYAKLLVESWAEKTDPVKHVFEDLGIAAFLIELWADMYQDGPFPGFVDIGCGNGLLVHILNREGYSGWGFDARRRTSWDAYETDQLVSPTGKSLERRLLLPFIVPSTDGDSSDVLPPDRVHDGKFAQGTFIISNHADELTPWTPILAAASDCPFLMIPCCSHDLSGGKFRPPPPKDQSKGSSTYASLVAWADLIAKDCGFEVETEMLRIPSTRNAGLLGRNRLMSQQLDDLEAIVTKYGGAVGYRATVAKLLKSGSNGH